MKWLLLILVFDVSNGGMKAVHQETRVFLSEESCNIDGRRLANSVIYPGEHLRSMSICIPESAYES
jgi:predicted ATP-dependent serine protease